MCPSMMAWKAHDASVGMHVEGRVVEPWRSWVCCTLRCARRWIGVGVVAVMSLVASVREADRVRDWTREVLHTMATRSGSDSNSSSSSASESAGAATSAPTSAASSSSEASSSSSSSGSGEAAASDSKAKDSKPLPPIEVGPGFFTSQFAKRSLGIGADSKAGSSSGGKAAGEAASSSSAGGSTNTENMYVVQRLRARLDGEVRAACDSDLRAACMDSPCMLLTRTCWLGHHELKLPATW